MDVPGKYAPTVAECRSDKPFQPLATRQHALGPAPFDPNLIAQGVPPDSRVTNGDNIFGPVEGTPMPPAAPQAAPAPPPVAVATYDPQTGRLATADGTAQQQTDLVAPAGSWKDLVWPAVP